MVFERLFKGRRLQSTAETVYEAIVAQARRPAFYTGYGVADRLEERFELLVLHVHLVVRRLVEGGETSLAQALFDTLFHDMDRSLRAIGVGDMSVGKKVKDMIRAYYGRTAAYDADLGDDAALARTLARNVFGRDDAGEGPHRLVRYIRAGVAALAAAPVEEIAAGRLGLPDPETTP